MKLIFSFLAPFYDRMISSAGKAAYGAAAREALEKVGEPDKILDISTGTGFLALSAARKLRSTLIVATDISYQMLLTAAKNAKARGLKLNLILADSRSLPFRDSSFDIVAAQNAPPYVEEMRRVSRDKILICYSFGGVLLDFAVNKVVEYLRKQGLAASAVRAGPGIYFAAAKKINPLSCVNFLILAWQSWFTLPL